LGGKCVVGNIYMQLNKNLGRKQKKSSKLYKNLVMKIIKTTSKKKMDSNVKYTM
jgi:hypothetical protein